MGKDTVVQVRFDDVHLEIIDNLKPYFGNSRPEVVRNLTLRWIEEKIGTPSIQELKKIRAIWKGR